MAGKFNYLDMKATGISTIRGRTVWQAADGNLSVDAESHKHQDRPMVEAAFGVLRMDSVNWGF